MDSSLRKKPRIQNNLRYYREKLGVTQKEMEYRTGVGNRHWPSYENGTHEPKVSLAQCMAAAFNDIAAEKEIELKRLTVDDLYPPQ
ncbi:helix-turn-helix transcriptional regulator [Desulfosporosinus youngiae]|uniref:Putative transcriptional regulator n=1 Tax=Desulfosporosinus youngiae DSM 17734 TaxID=768710 RepID=H5Y0C7_9FIRM|nr:helix-turn-helix transcriptional regulator [Desulfosporosinus youngiae]EHQ92106.1 putative transcriptional regulator [Desulfosporosinus youngiae DSM 17734]